VSLDDITNLHLVTDTDEAFELLRWLSVQDRLAIDTETTGLSPERDHVRLVQIGNEREAWAVPFEINKMVVLDAVRRFEGEWVTHNGPYDFAMLAKDGVVLPRHRTHNTLLQAHVLYSKGPLGLKPLYSQHVDERGAMLQDDLKAVFAEHKWTWATIPWDYPAYWQYGCVDTCETAQLDAVLRPQVMKVSPRSYELELAVSWVIERMCRKGAKVDRPYVERLTAELDEKELRLRKMIEDEWHVSPGSGPQIIKRLQKDGVELTKLTPKGDAYSTDKEALKAIGHPLADAVLEYRSISKITSTYLHGYLELSQWDGRIHPSINSVGGRAKNPFEPGGQDGVRTGRSSANDPNLQNVPKRGPFKKAIRRSFTVEDECFWLSSDFDQVEMRGMAHASQDPGLREAFLSPDDFFVVMGRNVFSEPGFTKEDERRQLIKNGMYAKIYGAGPAKFAVTAGLVHVDEHGQKVPLIQEADRFLRSVDRMYPGVPRFAEAVIAKGKERAREEGVAYVRSPLTGRRITADRGREYALVNYYVQGIAAEIMKYKILQLDAAGMGPYMMFPVHDEIDMEVPMEKRDEVIKAVNEIMNDPSMLSVPITASVSTGPNWGELEELAA
jgi:DNA polymerase-1